MRVITIGLTAVVAVTVALPLLPAFTPRAALASGVVGTGTPGSCTEGALDTALAGGGSVTFNCGASPFTLTVTTPKTIAADTSLDGGGLITLSGGGMVQIFTVNAEVTLAVTNTTFSGRSFYGNGGAIYNDGTLTVTNSTFSGNGAWGKGGAIYNDGTLTVTNSTFSGNGASYGGAIYTVGGTLTVADSTFSGNNNASYGGAIYTAGGTLAVTNTTFSGNTVFGNGGAIYNSGTLPVTNSTFSGNSAGGGGGAIYNSGTLPVTNSTFSGNSITGPGGSGWTIYNDGTATLKNTIVANGPFGQNCSAIAITDGGHNLRWWPSNTDTSCVGDFHDPKLSPLAGNGGPTQTMALQSGSAAVNAGDNTICAAAPVNNLDQRGFVRPGGGATNCSIGAFEFNSPAIPTLSTWGIIGFSSLAFAFVLWGVGRSRWRPPWDADC